MLELLWGVTSISVLVTVVMFGIAIVMFIASVILTCILCIITIIHPNNKLAKWARKHVNIKLTKN